VVKSKQGFNQSSFIESSRRGYEADRFRCRVMGQIPPVDLEINIGEGSDGKYPVTILHSVKGDDASAEFILPWAADELDSLLTRIQKFQTNSDDLRGFGMRLFSAVFNGDIKACYDASCGVVDQSHEGRLRIRLRIQPLELQRLPWELMWDEKLGDFLFASDRIQLTRYLPVSFPGRDVFFRPPIRMLIIGANPHERTPFEDIEAEKNSIITAFSDLQKDDLVDIQWLQPPTRAKLEAVTATHQFDLVHFFGHGDFREGKGYLLFEDNERYADPVDGRLLASILGTNRASIQLVMLNTCESGRAPNVRMGEIEAHYVSGVAHALVRAGIPAVVAMQFKIPEASARRFTQRFYNTLAAQLVKGIIDLEECVARARMAIQAIVGWEFADWAAPVIFLRPKTGHLSSQERKPVLKGENKSDSTEVEYRISQNSVVMIFPQKTITLRTPSASDLILEIGQGGLLRIFEQPPEHQGDQESNSS